jgi:hypothetical protein
VKKQLTFSQVIARRTAKKRLTFSQVIARRNAPKQSFKDCFAALAMTARLKDCFAALAMTARLKDCFVAAVVAMTKDFKIERLTEVSNV